MRFSNVCNASATDKLMFLLFCLLCMYNRTLVRTAAFKTSSTQVLLLSDSGFCTRCGICIVFGYFGGLCLNINLIISNIYLNIAPT